MTVRDEVWNAALETVFSRGKFRISELPFEEGEQHTVRRTLREMEDKGWLRRDSPQSPYWRLGSKAEILLEVDDDVLEAAQN